MDFAEKLRILRTNLKLTQQDIANLSGVSLRTYKAYELGERTPRNHEVLIKLANVFEVDVDSLINDEEEFVLNIEQKHGELAKKDAKEIIEGVLGLFAGGQMSLEDKKAVLDALEEAYYIAKIEQDKKEDKDANL